MVRADSIRSPPTREVTDEVTNRGSLHIPVFSSEPSSSMGMTEPAVAFEMPPAVEIESDRLAALSVSSTPPPLISSSTEDGSLFPSSMVLATVSSAASSAIATSLHQRDSTVHTVRVGAGHSNTNFSLKAGNIENNVDFLSSSSNGSSTTATTTRFITVTTTILAEDAYDDPLREIMYGTIFLSVLSALAAGFVLTIFGFQLRSRASTVMRNSLNYLWIGGLVCSIATSVICIVAYSFWLIRGNENFLTDRNACIYSTVAHDFFRTALAGLLLSYYVQIYIVRRFDEPSAKKGLPYYFAFAFTLASSVAAFSGIEMPKSFDSIGRCEGGMTSMTSAIPILVPVVIELGIVIAGLCAAFNLLCSDSRVSTTSSRRRVIAHIVFMLCLLASRAVVAIITVTRSSDSAVPERLSSLPVAVQALYLVGMMHNWMTGLIMAVVFAYSECLTFVVKRMLMQNDDTATMDEGASRKSAPVPFSEGESVRRRADSLASDVHALNRPFAQTEEGIVEDHLQAYTLSYTVRASSLYTEGALPPSGHY